MKTETKKKLFIAICALTTFLLWTVAISFIDVKAIGANGTPVGFSTINGWFHEFTGVHMSMYVINDWLGLIPFGVAAGFAILGLTQWIKRKKLARVDRSIIILGIYYVVVAVVYLLFEAVVINYRPVLINGVLEASYPSSTTMLVLCVMPTAIMQINTRIKSPALKRCLSFIIIAFTVFMVITRLISGVHWLTDIIGGVLISVALVFLYSFFIDPNQNI